LLEQRQEVLGEQPQVLSTPGIRVMTLEGGRDVGGRRRRQSAGRDDIGPFPGAAPGRTVGR